MNPKGASYRMIFGAFARCNRSTLRGPKSNSIRFASFIQTKKLGLWVRWYRWIEWVFKELEQWFYCLTGLIENLNIKRYRANKVD